MVERIVVHHVEWVGCLVRHECLNTRNSQLCSKCRCQIPKEKSESPNAFRSRVSSAHIRQSAYTKGSQLSVSRDGSRTVRAIWNTIRQSCSGSGHAFSIFKAKVVSFSQVIRRTRLVNLLNDLEHNQTVMSRIWTWFPHFQGKSRYRVTSLTRPPPP